MYKMYMWFDEIAILLNDVYKNIKKRGFTE